MISPAVGVKVAGPVQLNVGCFDSAVVSPEANLRCVYRGQNCMTVTQWRRWSKVQSSALLTVLAKVDTFTAFERLHGKGCQLTDFGVQTKTKG